MHSIEVINSNVYSLLALLPIFISLWPSFYHQILVCVCMHTILDDVRIHMNQFHSDVDTIIEEANVKCLFDLSSQLITDNETVCIAVCIVRTYVFHLS